MADISNRIEKYRKLRDYTQEELAQKAGLSRGGLSDMMKKNNFQTEILERIASALGVNLINLVSDIDVDKELLKKLSRDLDELSTQL